MERKDYILDMLYRHISQWLSGEEISRTLRISRTAVWKHIQYLRESGYHIESSSRHGHKLISGGNIISEYEITRNLRSEVFGCREIHIFEETDSTNIQAFRIASLRAPEGSIVIADTQTGGKGRLGRRWISPPRKNLYLSLIIRPQIKISSAPKITLVTAVALSDTLDETGAKGHTIKWPNDILYDGRKLSGILTEMKGDCDSIDFIIIGIGVNLNSTPEDYPDDIKNTAVSVKDITGKEADRVKFLTLFLMHFEKYYTSFLKGQFPEILEKWKIKSSIINRKIKVSNFDETFTGTVTGITPDGNLIVSTAEGTCQLNIMLTADPDL
jgi:BirA family biotin operon repressor/biotin-[acetyl-CoA-carboxylase] ligase